MLELGRLINSPLIQSTTCLEVHFVMGSIFEMVLSKIEPAFFPLSFRLA